MNYLLLTTEEEKILWKVIEEPSIREIINTKSGVERIKLVREQLQEKFPDVLKLPNRHAIDSRSIAPILPPPSADYWIARAVIYLLENKTPK